MLSTHTKIVVILSTIKIFRLAQGTTQLPSRDEMWQDIKAKRNAMQARYVTSPRHTIQVDWIPFMDDVAKEFGSKPNMGRYS